MINSLLYLKAKTASLLFSTDTESAPPYLKSIIGEWPEMIFDQPESLAPVHLKRPCSRAWSVAYVFPSCSFTVHSFLFTFVAYSSPFFSSSIIHSIILYPSLLFILLPSSPRFPLVSVVSLDPGATRWGTRGPLLMATNDWCAAKGKRKSVADERRVTIHAGGQCALCTDRTNTLWPREKDENSE